MRTRTVDAVEYGFNTHETPLSGAADTLLFTTSVSLPHHPILTAAELHILTTHSVFYSVPARMFRGPCKKHSMCCGHNVFAVNVHYVGSRSAGGVDRAASLHAPMGRVP